MFKFLGPFLRRPDSDFLSFLNKALKYRSATDIVRPIREIVRPREETTGFCPTKVKLRFIVCPTHMNWCPT
jgi:hypothetical protein